MGENPWTSQTKNASRPGGLNLRSSSNQSGWISTYARVKSAVFQWVEFAVVKSIRNG
jgi:hypothetical protein